jgi:hypothetical protein
MVDSDKEDDLQESKADYRRVLVFYCEPTVERGFYVIDPLKEPALIPKLKKKWSANARQKVVVLENVDKNRAGKYQLFLKFEHGKFLEIETESHPDPIIFRYQTLNVL